MRTVVCRIPIHNTSRPPARSVDPRPARTGPNAERRAAVRIRWGGDWLWPLSESVTVLVALMVFAWVGYLLGWFAGYEAGGLR